MDREIKNQLLENYIHNFYKGNLNFALELEDVEKMDWEWQDKFLNATFNSKLLKQYPVSSQFTKLFLKRIIRALEKSHDIHDGFYTALCTAMEVTNQETFCYRHYIISKKLDQLVTMKETRSMVVNGTTGLKTWEAALVLSDWAICNKSMFTNKNIVELGSGVGFAGITIGKMCDVTSMTLTDCHAEVLKTIKENIEINFSHFRRKEILDSSLYDDGRKSIGVRMLDWNDPQVENVEMVPDVLIGADIVYDPSLLEPMCNVIKAFSNKNQQLEVYIASVIRNEETFTKFLNTLDKMQFNVEEISMPNCVNIEWDETVHKCLLKIKF